MSIEGKNLGTQVRRLGPNLVRVLPRRGQPATYAPPPGLSTPIISIVDRTGKIIADEQRAVIRFAIQERAGAQVIFAAGTTGEWNRLMPAQTRIVAQLAVEECSGFAHDGEPVEAWIGITAHSVRETLANLEHALELNAHAVVVAPLAITDLDSPRELMEGRLSEVFARYGRSLPVFLYDNADIASDGKPAHLHTRDVKQMAALPYVHGIKVTANKAVLGNYTRAAAHFKRKGQFAIYPGNAYLIFDLFRPPEGIAGRARGYWNRYLMRDALPHGIVAGAANVMPREWRRAWQVSRRHQTMLMTRYQIILEQFRDACEFVRNGRPARLTIACLKTALKEVGVCASDAVAPGSPAFQTEERREFLRRFREVRRRAAASLEPEWTSTSETWSATGSLRAGA